MNQFVETTCTLGHIRQVSLDAHLDPATVVRCHCGRLIVDRKVITPGQTALFPPPPQLGMEWSTAPPQPRDPS